MKIGILGGSFDPPHIGHLLVIQQVLELRPDLDKILLVPSFQHQWKQSYATTDNRLAMLSSFVQEKVEVSPIELNRQGVSYSIDTVKEVKEQTNAEVFWIVGSDILGEFDRWQKADELIKAATFLVFPRDPYHLPEQVPTGFEVIQDKNLITTNISSTSIRNRVKAGKSISYLVTNEVEQYIKDNKLYL